MTHRPAAELSGEPSSGTQYEAPPSETTPSEAPPSETASAGAAPLGTTPTETPITLLSHGELRVHGQIPDASNGVLYCTVELDGRRLPCVYKPVAGERPLWDFPDGTLAQREVAAYEVSQATGWGLIPPTVLREGPYGTGMCQLWVGPAPGEASDDGDEDDGVEDDGVEDDGVEGNDGDHGDGVPGDRGHGLGHGTCGDPCDGSGPWDGDAAADGGEGAGAAGNEAAPSGPQRLLALVDGEEPGPGWKAVGFAEIGEGRTALLVHADDVQLRRLAVLDALINNADRKGRHLLPTAEGRLYAIDHGVSFHADNKLRTLLWGWAGEPLTDEALRMLRRLSAELAEGGPLATRLSELISPAELDALRMRTAAFINTGRHPGPSGDWPAIPWPPV